MAFLSDAQNFLQLRLRLKNEILGRAAATDKHSALAARAFGLKNDGSRFVHIVANIKLQLVSTLRRGCHVHSDGTVPGR